jgi:hypothetical protein
MLQKIDYEHESTPKCEGTEFFAGTEVLLAAAAWALQYATSATFELSLSECHLKVAS